MLSEAGKNFDWSARHTRMRTELVLISLVVFAIAHPDIKLTTTSFLFFDTTEVSTDYFLVGLGVWWVITAGHFAVRTVVEWNAVFAAFGELQTQLGNTRHELGEALREIRTNLPRPFAPNGEAERTVDTVLESINPKPDGPFRHATPEHFMNSEMMQMHVENHFNHAAERMISHLTTERERAEASYERFSSMIDVAQRKAAKATTKAAADFEALRTEIRGALRSRRLDRLGFGVAVPSLIAIALAIPSAPVVGRALMSLINQWL
jgi:hypothetical protein